MTRHLLAVALALLAALPAAAQMGQPEYRQDGGTPAGLRNVGIDQKLDQPVPADLAFKDDAGRDVRLSDYLGRRPVILVLAYYRCPMLCNQVLNGLVESLRQVEFDAGKEFEVVVVSFDAREKPELAAAKKANYLESYGRPATAHGWHFLTGEQPAIDGLTEATGFRYRYDAERDQFDHGSGIMLVTPEGKLARYFYGVLYQPRDLRLGLVETSENKIGSVVDQLMLYCAFEYNASTGKYTTAVRNLVRLTGALTVAALVICFFWARRRETRKARNLISVG